MKAQSLQTIFLYLAVAVIAVGVGVWQGLPFLMAAVFLLVFLWALSNYLEYGWYVLVFLSPLFNWEFSLAPFKYFFQGFPQFANANAPVVEFWAILMIAAFAVYLLRCYSRGQEVDLRLPGAHLFALFILSALISIINLDSLDRFTGFKYILHFLLLFYFGYLMLGANIVDSKKIWRRSLQILAFVGLFAAVMGFSSLFLGVWHGEGYRRAVPFPIWGWLPFGDQHIFLAEVITTTLPIFIYFWRTATGARVKNILGYLSAFMLVIGLLTLSRAGWLTIAGEAVIFLYVMRGQFDWRALVKKARWALIALVPLAAYFAYFMSSITVQRSTTARWYLTDIALHLFYQHPIIGQGIGSFVRKVQEIYLFRIEFGDALDAHGVIQKLLAEQGLLGLATFSLFMGWIITTVLRRYFDKRYTEEARLAYFVSFFLILSPLIFQLFNTQYYSSKMWVPIALALAQSIVYRSETNPVRLLLDLRLRKRKVKTEI